LGERVEGFSRLIQFHTSNNIEIKGTLQH
jgi:hypothetical protein